MAANPKTSLISACLLLLLTVLPSFAESVLIRASADSTVFITHPGQNYGSRTNLRVGPITDNDGIPAGTGGLYGRGLKRVFINFDTSLIPTNAYITNVIFRAFQTDGFLHAGGLHVFAVHGAWQENNITWSDQPTELTLLGPMSLVVSDLASFTNTALTELVRAWHNGAAAPHGLSLRVANEERASNGDTLASRESLTRPPPQLLIEYSYIQLRATRLDPATLQLSWPTNTSNYLLESTPRLPALPNEWTPVPNTPTISGPSYTLPIPLTEPTRFFRLRSR